LQLELKTVTASELVYQQALQSLHIDLEAVEEENELQKSQLEIFIRDSPSKKQSAIPLSSNDTQVLMDRIDNQMQVIVHITQENNALKLDKTLSYSLDLDLDGIDSTHDTQPNDYMLKAFVDEAHAFLCSPRLIDISIATKIDYATKIKACDLMQQSCVIFMAINCMLFLVGVV